MRLEKCNLNFNSSLKFFTCEAREMIQKVSPKTYHFVKRSKSDNWRIRTQEREKKNSSKISHKSFFSCHGRKEIVEIE